MSETIKEKLSYEYLILLKFLYKVWHESLFVVLGYIKKKSSLKLIKICIFYLQLLMLLIQLLINHY